MTVFIRPGAWLLMLIIALLTPHPFFLFCTLLYIFVWDGYELFLITAFVDAFFGASSTSVLYSVSLAVVLISGVLVRPYLSWYTADT